MGRTNRNPCSLNEIAAALGVSKATVSRALSGAEGVGKDLRQTIIRYANDIGYQPNTLAQGLARGHLNIIALILDDIRNPFYAKIAFEIQEIFNQHGYMLMVLNSESDLKKELQYVQMVARYNFSGLFLLTAHPKVEEEVLSTLKMPVVLVNRALASYPGNCVLLDNFQAGYLAARHLIERNHRRIGFICGPNISSASHQRYLGFIQAIENFGAENAKAYFTESNLTMESGYALATDFLNNPAPRPTAMIVSNDMTAIGFMNGLKGYGVRIPDDLSIVSFDNIPFSAAIGIELTTVDQHTDTICREAGRLMLNLLSKSPTEPERIIITPTLVVRKTTRFL